MKRLETKEGRLELSEGWLELSEGRFGSGEVEMVLDGLDGYCRWEDGDGGCVGIVAANGNGKFDGGRACWVVD
ncbi:hypothetical protein V6N13_013933 [Hibiscus sabdariffa]